MSNTSFMTKDDLCAENERLKSHIVWLEQRLVLERQTSLADRECYLPIIKIAEIVSAKTGISLAELRSNRRDSVTVTHRHVLMYLASIYTKCSLPRIGRYLNKDHTSVIHGRDRMKERLPKEPWLNTLVDELIVRVQKELARDVGIEPTSSGLEPDALPLS